MSDSSSIFSFDTLRGLPRPTAAFWLTVVLCVALRLLMAWQADRLDRIPSHCSNKRMMCLERKLVRENPVGPRIALMGNSLMRYGLVEDQVALAANVSPPEVVNLGLENGSAWDALTLLRRNPRLTERLQLVLYAIQPSEISLGSRDRWIDFFYQHSTLAERLSADRASDRAKLAVDWVWPFRSQRRDLPGWLLGLAGQSSDPTSEPLKPAWESPLLEQLKARASRYEQPPRPAGVIGVAGTVSRRHTRHLHDLVTFCEKRDIAFCLVTTPTRRVYDRVVATDVSLSAGQARFERLLDDLAVPVVRAHTGPLRDRIGLDECADFLDYCHLTPEGARKFTNTITASLTTQRLLPLSEQSAAVREVTSVPEPAREPEKSSAGMSALLDR